MKLKVGMYGFFNLRYVESFRNMNGDSESRTVNATILGAVVEVGHNSERGKYVRFDTGPRLYDLYEIIGVKLVEIDPVQTVVEIEL